MTLGQQILVGAYGVVVALCLVRHFIWSWAMKKTPWLSLDLPGMNAGDAPLVTILVPAKDEALGIADCLATLRAQDYPNFEILVADDRSVDATASIVEEISKQDPRVRLVRITSLPEGWTGKCNALQQLQQQARGEWLLFVDADTRHHPRCLSISLRDADEHGADMLSLMPALAMRSFWERVVQPFAAMCLMILYPLPQVNDPRRRDMGFANGQFILIRRRTYNAIKQHQLVKDKFVEDVHLGRLVRQGGHALRVAMAPDLFSVRMYASLAEITRGWSRILYSGVDAQPRRLWVLQAFILIFSVLGYVVLGGTAIALLAGVRTPFVWTMFALAVAHEVLQETIFARIYWTTRSRLDYLVFRPLAVFVMLHVVGRSIRMCRTHAVTWRGTTYDQSLQSASGGGGT